MVSAVLGVPLLVLILLAPMAGALMIALLPEHRPALIRRVAVTAASLSLAGAVYAILTYNTAAGGYQHEVCVPPEDVVGRVGDQALGTVPPVVGVHRLARTRSEFGREQPTGVRIPPRDDPDQADRVDPAERLRRGGGARGRCDQAHGIRCVLIDRDLAGSDEDWRAWVEPPRRRHHAVGFSERILDRAYTRRITSEYLRLYN